MFWIYKACSRASIRNSGNSVSRVYMENVLVSRSKRIMCANLIDVLKIWTSRNLDKLHAALQDHTDNEEVPLR